MANMTAIKSLIKSGDFVILPRKTYDTLVHSAKGDKDLKESLAQYRKGDFFGPYNLKQSMKFLESRGSHRRRK